ncbi:TPM domain-containing protein [Sphingomonas sp. DT-207]
MQNVTRPTDALAGCGTAPTAILAKSTTVGKAAAPPFAPPALTGRVVDNADLLAPAEEAALADKSAALESATGHQFVIVTLPSLDGRSIEEVGLALGNGWGIGRKEADDGVLLVVAPNEQKVRIEVGCGLEAALTDDEAKAILDTEVLPRFGKGQMVEGIEAGSRSIIREIT